MFSGEPRFSSVDIDLIICVCESLVLYVLNTHFFTSQRNVFLVLSSNVSTVSRFGLIISKNSFKVEHLKPLCFRDGFQVATYGYVSAFVMKIHQMYFAKCVSNWHACDES